jgi:hypothetical protein
MVQKSLSRSQENIPSSVARSLIARIGRHANGSATIVVPMPKGPPAWESWFASRYRFCAVDIRARSRRRLPVSLERRRDIVATCRTAAMQEC